MSSEPDTTYKIYFDPTKKDKNIDNSKTYENYVIHQNETLHIRVNELNNEVNRLTSSFNEIEEDNDRMEKSKGYMRNLLNNFNELDKLNIKWREESNKHYKEIQARNRKFIDFTYQCVVIVNTLFAIHLAISFYLSTIICDIFQYGIYGFFLYVSIKFYINTKEIEVNLVEKTDKVQSINEDIKKIKDCYDFINEYIDNV